MRDSGIFQNLSYCGSVHLQIDLFLAMFSLFSIYHHGYSSVGLGNRDDKESLKWCEMAAENGVPHAQKWMYKFYSEGIGVEKDEEVANMWKQRMEERKHK